MNKRIKKFVDKNIPELKNKTIVITGGTGGIGFHMSKYLAYKGAHVILAARNQKKTMGVIKSIQDEIEYASLEYKYLDLTDMNSVISFIDYMKQIKIDYLFINSGIYHQERKKDSLGLEIHFNVNCYVPYLMIKKLISEFIANQTQIIITASLSYMFAKVDPKDLMGDKVKDHNKLYGKTKRLLCQVLYKLQCENPGLKITFAHPGITASTLFESLHGNLFWKIAIPIMKHIFMSNEKAALPMLYAIDKKSSNRKWYAPRGIDQAWGFPKLKGIKKDLFDLKGLDDIFEQIDDIDRRIGEKYGI
jgi:short-subunit dehydrogenase